MTIIKVSTYLLILLISNANAGLALSVGSCSDQERSLDYFKQVRKLRPYAWIWLGDSIYADHMNYNERKAAYNIVKYHPEYRKLRKSSKIYGIWDDHDYAFNNAGRGYEGKKESKELFMDFMDISSRSPLRWRKGTYRKVNFRNRGYNIDLFLLDTRSFYSKAQKKMLGQKQWSWLNRGIRKSSADVIMIATSIPILTNFHLTNLGLEGWADTKHEREKLLNLVSRSNAKILFLSGDRHYSEFSRRQLKNKKIVYEFMASGLTHTSIIRAPNRYRFGKAIRKKNFGMIKFNKSSRSKIKIEMSIHSTLDGRVLSSENI